MMAFRILFGTIGTWHGYTSSASSSSTGELIHHFELMTLLLFIDPIGELHIVHDIILFSRCIISIIVLLLAKGNLAHVGPLVALFHVICAYSHATSCERRFHVPLRRKVLSYMSYLFIAR